MLLLLSRFSRVWLCVTPETAAHQAPHPWDSPGRNTGVSCHFLLQCMKVKSEREVAQSCPTPSDPMDCSLPGSPVPGILQARTLEWGAISFSMCIYTYTHNVILLNHEKKKELLSFATAKIVLKDIVLNKISQTKKGCVSLICGIFKANWQKQRVEWWLPESRRWENGEDVG